MPCPAPPHVLTAPHRPDAHKNLLQNLLSFDWRAAENVVVAYVHLIGLLVSANPNFLPPVAQMIVRNLVADGTTIAFLLFVLQLCFIIACNCDGE